MRRRRQRTPLAAIDQINVTPLLDLTFLLLIAFMLTMPLMEYGTDIEPPEMNSKDLPQDNFKSVTMTKTGTLVFDSNPVEKDLLIEKLKEAKKNNPKLKLLLRADGSRSYKEVMELMALIRSGGFGDVTLVTQAEGKSK